MCTDASQHAKKQAKTARIAPFHWKKGQSGNPGGRKRGPDLAAEVAQAIFEGNPDAIYKAMLKALKKGNPKVYTALADRAFGKLKEKFEVTGDALLVERLNAGRKRLNANG